MPEIYSIDLMSQLANALSSAGFTAEDITQLYNYPQLGKLKKLVRGESDIVTRIINCNIKPSDFPSWEIVNHIKGGKIPWKPKEIKLYVCDEQKNGLIKGGKLYEKLKDKSVMNVCVLLYLLANPHLYPEWWDKYVCFWGTTFRSLGGNSLNVFYLYWRDGLLSYNSKCLAEEWDDTFAAAVSCK